MVYNFIQKSARIAEISTKVTANINCRFDDCANHTLTYRHNSGSGRIILSAIGAMVPHEQTNERTENFERRLKPLCPIHQERIEITDINIM